jgi:hypothetical protein
MPNTTRTKEERMMAVKPILQKLTELSLRAADHSAIRELISKIQVYIQHGERIEINIPFPIADVDIVGLLTPDANERVWVKLTRG